jgi:allantoin permease
VKKEAISVTHEEIEEFRERGYENEDVLPKPEEKRNTSTKNFFTLWMGSIHNIPNYAAVGGFLLLGLSPFQVMLAIAISGIIVALFMSYNGRAGASYGIPFSMHLRSTYGNIGAKLPGFLRGVVAAIAWFSLQTYTGSAALLILIGKIWPGFLEIGNGMEILGITIPGLITFLVFWLMNIAIGFGGGDTLNRFTGILTPIIYIVFGAMSIWAIRVGGGLQNIMTYSLNVDTNYNTLFAMLIVISSVLAVWAAPGVSVSDFTQNAKSNEDQTKGQISGLAVGYLVFAFMSVVILIGGSLHFNGQENDVLDIINKWDSLPAIIISTLVFLSTTISTNATGNIIPAAYQLSALFPKKINYQRGVLLAGIISIFILPWKFMGEGGAIITFLNLIGALLGPVGGVMIAHYYFVKKRYINLDELYMDEDSEKGRESKYYGINGHAYIATLGGLFIVLAGQFIPSLSVISDISWIAGFVIAVVIYLFLVKFFPKEYITGITLEDETDAK